MRGQRHVPAALYPRYPLYRRLGGPQGRSGQVWKISPPPGFDPRTVQPVASRYTDYASRPVLKTQTCTFIKNKILGNHKEYEYQTTLPPPPPLNILVHINPLNAELNPICHLPVLLGAHHILHISRIRVKHKDRMLTITVMFVLCK